MYSGNGVLEAIQRDKLFLKYQFLRSFAYIAKSGSVSSIDLPTALGPFVRHLSNSIAHKLCAVAAGYPIRLVSSHSHRPLCPVLATAWTADWNSSTPSFWHLHVQLMQHAHDG